MKNNGICTFLFDLPFNSGEKAKCSKKAPPWHKRDAASGQKHDTHGHKYNAHGHKYNAQGHKYNALGHKYNIHGQKKQCQCCSVCVQEELFYSTLQSVLS